VAEQLLGAILPPDAVRQVLDGEPQLFAWLEKDKSHPARLAMDPLAAFTQAGVKLAPRTVEAIRRHREAQRRVMDPAALADLASLRVEVATGDMDRHKAEK
jgi:hypothetical protein